MEIISKDKFLIIFFSCILERALQAILIIENFGHWLENVRIFKINMKFRSFLTFQQIFLQNNHLDLLVQIQNAVNSQCNK